MATLRSVFVRPGIPKALGRAMTDQEVRTIAADRLVAIGAQTGNSPGTGRIGRLGLQT